MEHLRDLAKLRFVELIFTIAKFRSYLVSYLASGRDPNKQKYRQRFSEVIEELEFKRACNAEFRMHESNLEKELANLILPVILSAGNIFSMVSSYVKCVRRISDAHLKKFLDCIVIDRCSRNFFIIDTVGSCRNIIADDSFSAEDKFLFYCLIDKHLQVIEFCDLSTNLSFIQKFEVAIICNAGLIVRHLWNNATEDDRNALLQTSKESVALKLASVIGAEDIVNWFLNREVSSNCKNISDGNCLLHIAAKAGNVQVMEILIEKNADVNARNAKRETPVHSAAEGGFENAIELLWNNNSVCEPVSLDGNTPLHIAVENGQDEVVSFLLMGNANIEAINNQKSTPLHIAAIKGHLGLVELLIKRGANVDALDSINQTPLHKACCRDLSDVAEVLIKLGHANVNCSENKTSVLHTAATRGHLKTVLVLLEGHADPNAEDETGKTPLHWAAYYGHYSVAITLLRKDANLFAQDKQKETPLHNACKRGHDRIVELFLKMAEMHHFTSSSCRNVSLVNCQDQNGRTPLHFAARNGHEAAVRCLLSVAEIEFLFDKKLRSALHEAAWNGHIEIILLLKDRADAWKLIYCKDHRGATALQLAINFKQLKVVNYLRDATSVLLHDSAEVRPNSNLPKRKRKPSLNISGKNEFGETSLHVAVRDNDIPKVMTLLGDKMLKVNAKNSKNETALHLAVANKCTEILERLLSCSNIDANAINDDGETPLHCAVRAGNVDALKVLFRNKKVKINSRNSSQEIPLHLAVESGNSEVLKLLLTRNVDFRARMASGKAAVQIACEQGNAEIFLLVLEVENRFSADVRDGNGNTLLHLAVKNKHAEITRWIVSNLPELVGLVNSSGDTCLHLAVRTKQVDLVKAILDAHEQLVNVPNNCQETPLLLAASMTKVPRRIIKCLLENPFVDVNAKLRDGRTALHLLAAKLNAGLVQLLLQKNVDVGARDRDGTTALHVWVQKTAEYCNGLDNIENTLKTEKYELLKKILSCSYSHNIVNFPDSKGNSVLHLSALTGIVDILEILLKVEDIDVNMQNNLGETALHLACENGHFLFVKRILEEKRISIDIECGIKSPACFLDFVERNVADDARHQRTPLAVTLNNRHWNIVYLLLRKGANVNIVIDAYGTSPLDLAVEEGQSKIVEIILERM